MRKPFSKEHLLSSPCSASGTAVLEAGRRLDSTLNQVSVVVFSAMVLGLLTFGYVMLASTSSALAFHGDAFYFAKRQALWMGLGLVACACTAHLNYQYYRKLAWPLFAMAVALLAGVLVFGARINGSIRWFVFGPLRFQPSEYAKYVLVILQAFWLERMQHPGKGEVHPRIGHWWWGVWAPIAMTCLPAGLIFREPDLGSTLLLGAVTMVLHWAAGSPSHWLGGIAGAGLIVVVGFLVAIFKYDMFQDAYQVQRILHWWREDDLSGSNYQQWIAMLAFGRGGIHGEGLGKSVMKLAYLPEAHTDFIFPIIGEELGLVASLAVVAAFCLLVISGLRLATRAPDTFGMLLAVGIVAVIGVQALINIAVVTNSIPNKGMPLPFISYGGSNLVMTLAATGVLLNVFGQCETRACSISSE